MIDQKLLEKARELHPTIDESRKCHSELEDLVFDEKTGTAVTLRSKVLYGSGFYNGIVGMEKVVTVYHPDGRVQDEHYTYANCYDSRNPNYDWNFITNIRMNPESTPEMIVLDAKTLAKDQTLRYRIWKKK